MLREAGLVTVRVAAQRRFYRLDPTGLDDLDGWVATQRRFWQRHLAALDREIAARTGPATPEEAP